MCRLWGLWEMNNGKWTSQESEIALRTGNNNNTHPSRSIYLHTTHLSHHIHRLTPTSSPPPFLSSSMDININSYPTTFIVSWRAVQRRHKCLLESRWYVLSHRLLRWYRSNLGQPRKPIDPIKGTYRSGILLKMDENRELHFIR